MTFSVEGRTYSYPDVKQLAVRSNMHANIEESVIETPDGKIVWLTVVGDEEAELSPCGILRGWYVAVALPSDLAQIMVKGFQTISGDRV